MEILAPLGKLENLAPLIEAGANAVYAGAGGLSSRPEAFDLTIQEFDQAVQYAHSKGCKVYAAINACLSDDSLIKATALAEDLDKARVDAVIAADYGMISMLADRLKYSEIHASTLLGVYNSQTVDILRRFNVKRIVLSSDLLANEIAELIKKNNDMEYEIIAAGGICFQCNRQCRLPHGIWESQYHVACQSEYRLLRNGKSAGKTYRIGAPTVRLYTALGLYAAMGITSYKIEGRTNKLEDICKRVKELEMARRFIENRTNEIPGYLHYISRYAEGIEC